MTTFEYLFIGFTYVLVMPKNVYEFTVLIEQDESGWYVAKVPDLEGCHTQGKTVEQVLERIKEAIAACLEAEQMDHPHMKFIGVQNIEVQCPDPSMKSCVAKSEV